jgi:xanthine dehydrogenase molybdopterin-binding subunit B
VPINKVFLAETLTDKCVALCFLQVPNASPTAGSASTDLYGMAVLDACRQINERLKPYRWAAVFENNTDRRLVQEFLLVQIQQLLLLCCAEAC